MVRKQMLKRMRARKRLLCIGALIVLAGCMSTSAPFTDDFSDPASGWGASSHETYVRGYQQGRYLMQIDVPHWFVWTTAGRNFDDVALEVVVRSEQAADNHYGLFCRYTEGQFYYFAVSTDGYYAIFRRTEDGDLLPLTGRAMLRSPLIHTDGTENRLQAVCKADELRFFINGEQAVQIADDTLERGDVGMAAGTLNQGGTIVWFDNLDVSKPVEKE
jgi:hypothetical protein